jgi:hypothetical protein
MLYVWAQFELQVGIMCASAPALRVFFRRYLGVSQSSTNASSRGTMPKKSITVIRDMNVDFDRNGAAVRPIEKLESHELRDLGTPISEDGEDGLSDTSRARERDLTRYSHEESHVAMTRSSWLDTDSAKQHNYRNRI